MWLLALLVLPPERAAYPEPTPAEQAHREALIRFGLGVWHDRRELPVQAVKQLEAAAKAEPDQPAVLLQLLRVYLDLGREAAAMRVAKRLLELEPTDTATARELGLLLIRAKRAGEASLVLKKAAEQTSAEREPVRKLGLLSDAARAAELAQDWPGTIDLTRQALEHLRVHREKLASHPSFGTQDAVTTAEAEFLEKLGDRQLSLSRFDDAEQSYKAAAKLWNEVLKKPAAAARVHWNLSGLLLKQDKLEAALAETAKFVSLGPSTPEPYQRLALLQRRTGRRDEVLGTLAQLEQRYPKVAAIRWVLAAETLPFNPDASSRMVQDLLKKGEGQDFSRVIVHAYIEHRQAGGLLDLLNAWEKSYRQDDEDKPKDLTAEQQKTASAVRRLSQAIKSNDEAARAVLEHALASGERYPTDVVHFLQELADQLGRPEQAIEFARQAYFGDPRKYFHEYYWKLYRARKWRECLELCDQGEFGAAAQANARGFSIVFPFYRALPLAELGRTNEALLACTRLAARLPHSGRLKRLAVLGVLNRHAEAVQYGLEQMKLVNGPEEARDLKLALAHHYQELKQYEKAEAMLRELLDDDPDDITVLNNLGYNLAVEGRKLAEAEQLVRHAIELERDSRARRGERDLNNGGYLDSLGWVLFRRGKLQEARLALELAVKSADTNGDGIIWDHLGDVAFRQGDSKRALEAWMKAAELYEGSHVGVQQGRRDEVTRKIQQAQNR